MKPDPAATGTWSCDILFNPDGASHGYARILDSVGERFVEFINTQMDPNLKYDLAKNNFTNQFERWREVYAGVTVYQDGPTLSDQGTVAACQYGFDGNVSNAAQRWETSAGSNITFGSSARGLVQYPSNKLPSYEMSQAMPNAYFNQSKFGVYMPLRLGPNHQVWKSQADILNFVASRGQFTGSTYYPQVPFQEFTGIQGIQIPAITPDYLHMFFPAQDALGDAANMRGYPPHPQLYSACYVADGTLLTSKATGMSSLCEMMPQLANNVGAICFRNMAVATGLQLYFRVGLEAQCRLGSSFAPYLKVAPAYDPLAVENYYRISRELKDAYPADFNDLGKLWDTIKSVARSVIPSITRGLSFVPGPVGMIAQGVGALVNPLLEGGGNTAPRDKPPAAALERVQESLKQPRRQKAGKAQVRSAAIAKNRRKTGIKRRG